MGFVPRLTYGLVLLFHGRNTFASYAQYFHPVREGEHFVLRRLAMLAACFALYYLRNLDTRGTLAGREYSTSWQGNVTCMNPPMEASPATLRS